MTPRAKRPLGGRGTNQYAVRGQSVDNSREESDSIKRFGKFARPPKSSVSVNSSSEELKSALFQLRDAIRTGDDGQSQAAERSIRENSSPAYASSLIDHEMDEARSGEGEHEDIADHAQGDFMASAEDLEDSMKSKHPDTARMASLIMTVDRSGSERSATYSAIEEERSRLNRSRFSRIGL